MITPRRFVVFALACLVAGASWAEDIRIVVPYVGTLTDVQAKTANTPELKDTGLLTGLYFQWINPEAYQWNVFAYYAPDVNYTSTIGGHLIYDRYFGHSSSGKFLVGAGLETMRMNMDAGTNLGTDSFDMKMSFLIPYARVGKYFTTKAGPADLSILPWVGVEPQWLWGDLTTVISMGPGKKMTIEQSLDDSALYAIAGLNLKVNLYHFIDLEGKYQATFDSSDYFNTWNAIANVYLSRHWGLSYRFKYMETSTGENYQNYFGVAAVF
jgi:hypothetical protein